MRRDQPQPGEAQRPSRRNILTCLKRPPHPTLIWQVFELDATGALHTKTGGQCLAGRDRYVPPAPGVAGVQLWAKPLGGGRTAALFINGGWR